MLPWLVALLCVLAACVGFVAGVLTDACSSGSIAHSYADLLAHTRGSRFPMRPDVVYWLDGIEDPEPALFFAEQDAKDAAIEEWKANNAAYTEIKNIDWLYVDSAFGDPKTDFELDVNHERTGLIIRPLRPKGSHILAMVTD